jgi:hypothetical protein
MMTHITICRRWSIIGVSDTVCLLTHQTRHMEEQLACCVHVMVLKIKGSPCVCLANSDSSAMITFMMNLTVADCSLTDFAPVYPDGLHRPEAQMSNLCEFGCCFSYFTCILLIIEESYSLMFRDMQWILASRIARVCLHPAVNGCYC